MTAAPMNDTDNQQHTREQRTPKIRRNALWLALFAFAFYAGFILMGVLNS